MFASIRQRPAMWLGNGCTTASLKNLLDGFEFAEDHHGIPTESRLFQRWRDDFEAWAQREKYHDRLSVDSTYMALLENPSDSLTTWFEWYVSNRSTHAVGYDDRGVTRPLSYRALLAPPATASA